MIQLELLLLSYNQIKWLDAKIFQNTTSLTFIDLSNNRLKYVTISLSLTGLAFLNLRYNPLTSVDKVALAGLHNESEILVSQHEICVCYVPSGVNCSAANPRSPYLTCDRLLSDMTLTVVMWVIGLNALLGNLFVIFWRIRNLYSGNVQNILLHNLASSDTLMGIYMIIIVCVDMYYGDNFPMNSESWRNSVLCRIAGALSITSSEASVFFLTLLTLDRFVNMKYPYSVKKLGKTSTKYIVLCIWIISFVLGIVPSTLAGSVSFKFYDNSHVCTALPLALRKVYTTEEFGSQFVFTNVTIFTIDDSNTTGQFLVEGYEKEVFTTTFQGLTRGLYFSSAIFLGLNCVCFLVILICYIDIVMAAKRSAKEAGRSRELREQIRLTVKISAIIGTDFLCWFPIVVMGILVQLEITDLPPSVYAWSVTFVLPINSAINPYLYTIAEVLSKN